MQQQKRTIEEVEDREIVDTFRGIASDLATVCHDAGAKGIHLDDAADATFNALRGPVAYTKEAFPRIKAALRKSFLSGRRQIIEF